MKFNIKVIQEAINSKPCDYCGKAHHVELDMVGGVLQYRFSDDACQEYQDAVRQFVNYKYNQSTFPFP